MSYTISMIKKRKSNAPGLSFREGMTTMELLDLIPDNAAAEKWFEFAMWGKTGRYCPHCGAVKTFQTSSKVPSKKYRCSTCYKYFTVKTNTFLHGTHIPLRKWVFGVYLMLTHLRGFNSMKAYRDLGITQKTAWFMLHRIRNAMDILPEGKEKLSGSVEVDETYIGGKEGNRHASKKLRLGRGSAGKVAVMGARERETGLIKAEVVEDTSRETSHGFISKNVTIRSQIYTDEAHAYKDLVGYDHDAVKHSVGEYVKGKASTNGIESFWAMLKRGYVGTYYHMSKKHLQRYVTEFFGRNNIRTLDTITQMLIIVHNAAGTHLPYKKLIDKE